MLFPRKTKYRKMQKNRFNGIEINTFNPIFSSFGIKSLMPGRITSQQLESVRKLISRKTQKSGSVVFRVFPFLSVTSKPAETRMGKGKGSLDYWCFPIKPGRVILELQGVALTTALTINKLVNSKLCLKTRLVKNI